MEDTNQPYTYTFSGIGDKITPAYCGGACYRSIKTTSNTSHVNYLLSSNDKLGNYKKTVVYRDTLVDLTCDKDEDTQLGCDYVDCFDTGEQANPNVIGMELKDEDTEWYYSNSHVTRSVKVDKPYCENLGNDSYFYPDDERCHDSDLCNRKSNSYCQPIINAEAAAFEELRAQIEADFEESKAIYEQERELAWLAYLETNPPTLPVPEIVSDEDLPF